MLDVTPRGVAPPTGTVLAPEPPMAALGGVGRVAVLNKVYPLGFVGFTNRSRRIDTIPIPWPRGRRIAGRFRIAPGSSRGLGSTAVTLLAGEQGPNW